MAFAILSGNRCRHERSDAKSCYHEIWPTDGNKCVFHSEILDKTTDFGSKLKEYIVDVEQKGKPWFNSYDFTDFIFPELKLSGRTFVKPVIFLNAKVHGAVELFGVRFEKGVKFELSEFLDDVCLSGSTFYEDNMFLEVIFHRLLCLNSIKVIGTLTLERINQKTDQIFPKHILDFRSVVISKNGLVRIATVNLKKALLIRTDLSSIDFFEAVWEDEKFWGGVLGKRAILYDEKLHTDGNEFISFNKIDRIGGSYEMKLLHVEYLYRQLKKNYDDKTYYAAAGEFHIGEMEVRFRRNTQQNLLKPFYWLFSPTIWYRRLSTYGENYWRALGWIVLALLTFTWLFMVSGLGAPGNCSQPEIDYMWARHIPLLDGKFWVDTFKASKHTLSIFYFSRLQYFEACGEYGPFLNILGYLVSILLHALLLLALRRRFKR